MKLRLFFISSVIFLCSNAQSQDIVKNNSGRPAIQGAFVTGGNLSIGLAYYTKITEMGINFSANINNYSKETQIFTPAIFAGLIKNISNNTYFAYGLDLGTTIGHEAGQTIKNAISVGPYISLEQALTPRLLLIGWIQPYSYDHENIGSISTSTNHIFNTGGVALSYFF